MLPMMNSLGATRCIRRKPIASGMLVPPEVICQTPEAPTEALRIRDNFSARNSTGCQVFPDLVFRSFVRAHGLVGDVAGAAFDAVVDAIVAGRAQRLVVIR